LTFLSRSSHDNIYLDSKQPAKTAAKKIKALHQQYYRKGENDMIRNYLVISTWYDKVSGLQKGTLAEINTGLHKDGKGKDKPYNITDTSRTMNADGDFEIGSIVSYTMTPTQQSTTSNKN